MKLRINPLVVADLKVIQDYIMFYEILGSEVYVLRVLPAKSNWMNTILKQI